MAGSWRFVSAAGRDAGGACDRHGGHLHSRAGPLADDFAGLSYETKREMPDEAGKYYFSDDNTALAAMFRTLGIKNLRIGGNTVDSPKVSIPGDADIDQLFAFAKAADAKVIYSFRLHNGDAAGSATQAKYIADHYAPNLLCFSIGNEPDIYIHTWDGYMKNFQPIYDAINLAVPDAKYCGPSLTSNARPWAHDFAAKYFPEGKIVYIGQHEYAGGAGGKQKDPRGRPRPDALAGVARHLPGLLRQARPGARQSPRIASRRPTISTTAARRTSATPSPPRSGPRLSLLVGGARLAGRQFPQRR